MEYGSVFSLYSKERAAADVKNIGSQISSKQQEVQKIKSKAVARKCKGKARAKQQRAA